MDNLNDALACLYATWGDKLAVITNRGLSFKERLAALHWIDDQIGEGRSPGDDLEAITDQLLLDR